MEKLICMGLPSSRMFRNGISEEVASKLRSEGGTGASLRETHSRRRGQYIQELKHNLVQAEGRFWLYEQEVQE